MQELGGPRGTPSSETPAMESREPRGSATSHDAIPAADDAAREHVAPYEGLPGQTRYESVHLVEPDGSLRSIAVCRAVNVRTHPELRARVLAGLLHRLDDGRELAVPFVYHDPDALKFALVIPPQLAHVELKEWSKLMGEIAGDTRHAVPAYVKDSMTVLGIAALTRFLETDTDSARSQTIVIAQSIPPEREQLLLQRERELAEQERSLIRMAEGFTAREGTLLRREEQLETARVDLEIREAELNERASARELRSGGGWQQVSGSSQQNDATVVANFTRELAANAALVSDSEQVAAGGTGTSTHRSVPPPLRPRTRPSGGPPPLPHRPHATPPPLTTRRFDDAPTVVARPSEPPPLPGHLAEAIPREAVTSDEDHLAEPAPEPEVEAPAYFEAQRPGQMALKLADDELWLFVQLDQEHQIVFRRGAELMLQYAETDGYPVVVLSLVDQNDEDPYAIRLALDGRAEADMRVIEHLSRSFRARVALHVDGLFTQTVTVSTLREGVAQAICDKIDALPHDHHGGPSPADALVRVLHSPPPLWNDDLPFGPARRETPSTVAVQAAVDQLSSWLRPDKLAQATLIYSVPRHVIDASLRRVVRAAIVFGIALPSELAKLAVEHAVVADEHTLLRDQLQAFRQRVEQGENDLGAEATRHNWDALFLHAERLELAVEPELRALAEGAAAADGGTLLGSERALESLTTHELKALLAQPGGERIEAIRELCTRGHPSAIDTIFAEVATFDPPETAIAVAHLVSFGEAVGDDLINALGSSHEHVRQCAALGLGRLRLRRALAPLLKQLEQEQTPAWTELARAFGDFGMGALRAVARSIPGSSHPERFSAVLGHLANHGCSKDVEKMENDPDPDIAQAARRAMARRSRMEWEDLAVREQRTLSDPDPAARLSQLFFAEAPKADI